MWEIIFSGYTWLLTFLTKTFPEVVSFYWVEWINSLMHISPVSLWIYLQIIIILILIVVFKFFQKSRFWMFIDFFVEKVYSLFEEILEIKGNHWIKNYVTTLFFVILISNFSAWILDIVRIIFVDVEWLSSVVSIPTTSLEFNGALAIVSIFLMLKSQVQNIWPKKTFLEYLPINGKGMITMERGKLPAIVYYPLFLVIKLFDIAISIFIGILDIVGLVAKVISLSARLYGNMMSWWVLLTMLVVGVGWMTESLLWAWHSFPILAPIILYIQSLLVVLIQAFVFPLLVAIFMKLVQVEETEETEETEENKEE